MAPDNQRYVDEKKSPLTVRIYPKGTSTFLLYEDDGASYDYEKGIYALTTFRCIENNAGITVTKSAPKGSYKVPARDHIFRVHKEMAVKSVTTADKKLRRFTKKAMFDSAAEGWFYDATGKIMWAKVKGGANKPVSVQFWKIAPLR
jgi:hypothetical protein